MPCSNFSVAQYRVAKSVGSRDIQTHIQSSHSIFNGLYAYALVVCVHVCMYVCGCDAYVHIRESERTNKRICNKAT